MRIMCLFSLVFVVLCSSACSNYDSFRIRTIEGLKESHSKVVERAKEGKLSKIEYRSSLETYDKAMLDEQAKNGSGLAEMQKKNEAASDAEADRLFP